MKQHLERIFLMAPVGPYAIGESFLRAFSDLGFRVAYLNHLKYFPIVYGLPRRLIRRLSARPILDRYNRALRDGALWFRPDLVVIAKGNSVYPGTLEEIREGLPGVVLVNINYDDFLSPSPSNRFPDLERTVRLYDWIFPSKVENVAELRQRGARRVHYLPLGYDETAHYPVLPGREIFFRRRSQLIFAGTYTDERARHLETLAKYDLAVWGAHWKRKNVSPELWRRIRRTGNNRILRGAELSAVLNASGIALNFLRRDNRDTHNHRSFELPACGVFTLSQGSEELKTFFAEGEEMAFFASPEELREKAGYYLEHEGERERMARAARLRLQRGRHTIRDRAESILRVIREGGEG